MAQSERNPAKMEIIKIQDKAKLRLYTTGVNIWVHRKERYNHSMKIYISSTVLSAETLIDASDFYVDAETITIKAGIRREIKYKTLEISMMYADDMIKSELKDNQTMELEEQYLLLTVDADTSIKVFKAFRNKNLLKEK